MKILYVTLENLSLHKGSVVHIKEVIDGLRRRGHQIGLVGSASTKLEKPPHFYNIHPKAFFPFKYLIHKEKAYFVLSLLLLVTLFKVLRQYDLIYARDFHAALISFIPRVIYNKKLIFEMNGIANEEQRLKSDSILNRVFAFFVKKAEKIATHCSDWIISVTPQIEAYLIKIFHCPPEKITVIGNGVNTKIFYPIADKDMLWRWKERLEIAKDDTVIAFVGNLAPWQGVSVLIESAFSLLQNSDHLKFLIVGEGSLKDSLIKKVSNSGFEERFIFTGMMEYKDVPILINLADICVAPFISRRNRTTGVSPIKIFEYMACGKPIITSRIEGLEFVEREGAGCLIEPEDVIGLREELFDLIKNPQKRAKMGNNGLKIAREKFDWGSKSILIEKVLKALA